MAMPFFFVVTDWTDGGRDFQIEIAAVDGEYRLHTDLDDEDALRDERFPSLQDAIAGMADIYPEPAYSIRLHKSR